MAKIPRIAHYCPVQIKEDVLEYAAAEVALKKCIDAKSKKFVKKGTEVYLQM